MSGAEHTSGTVAGGPASDAPLCERILVIITEDWFALSHFKPLLAELVQLAREVVVATNSSGRLSEIEALGVRAVPFSMQRGSFKPWMLLPVRQRLAALIDAERPDVVHAISLQPMLLASLALPAAAHKPQAIVLHITGLGYIAASRSAKARSVRTAIFAIIRWATRKTPVWLLAENPDDLAAAISRGVGSATRTSISPGAGVDPEEFAALAPPNNVVPRAAYVGRLIASKGVDVLVAAHKLLADRGVALELALCGAPDVRNPDAVTDAKLAAWKQQPGLSFPGHISDVREVWRQTDVAVVPTLGGEGIPRALLEAAACARPIVASDVPGCNHFVRDGVEGALVPAGDAVALAAALERLCSDGELRRRQGDAARARLVSGYTTAAVQQAIRDTYRAVLKR